jgi:hypothetical protein
VRSARAAGASWAEVGRALGSTRQSAWEAHRRWIDGQAAQHGQVGRLGFDADQAAAARDLAGHPDADRSDPGPAPSGGSPRAREG